MRLLKAAKSLIFNRRHILREFVSTNLKLRYEDPRDWLKFKMAVEREMAARRPLPEGISRLELAQLLPEVETTPIRILPIAMNGYNVSWLELVCLAAITASLKPSKVIEFGTFDGRTTVQFAANTDPPGRVTTIDCMAGPVDFGDATGFCTPTTIGRHFLGSPRAGNIDVLTVDSQSTDWSPHRGTADLVFVDADHSRDAVLRDSRTAAMMLRCGGMIVWHDFLYLDGVTSALAELAHEMPIHHIAGTTLAVHRAAS
jgi:hypothetical protein